MTRPSPSEIDALVARAAGPTGDRAAFERLILHVQDELLASIRRKIGRRSAGALVAPEDVLQETLSAASRAIVAFDARGGEAFLGWLKTIARSRLLNMIEAGRARKRGGGRKPATSIGKRAGGPVDPGSVIALVEHLAATTDRPSVAMRRREAVARATLALAQLDPEPRSLIEMHVVRGLPHAQVAKELGKSEGAVKMALARALAKMRELTRQPPTRG